MARERGSIIEPARGKGGNAREIVELLAGGLVWYRHSLSSIRRGCALVNAAKDQASSGWPITIGRAWRDELWSCPRVRMRRSPKNRAIREDGLI